MLNWLKDGVITPYRDPTDSTVQNWSLPESGGRRATVVSDIMSSPVRTIRASESLGQAHKKMKDHGIAHLAVLDEGQFSGLISDRDILSASFSEDFVGLHMSRELLLASRSERITRVASVMVEYHVHCMPVLDDSCYLVGMITTSDILNCMTFQAPMDFWY